MSDHRPSIHSHSSFLPMKVLGDPVEDEVCNACGFESEFVPEGMIPCERCNQVYYCSLECLQWDWKSGGHRKKCARVSAATSSVVSNSDDESFANQLLPEQATAMRIIQPIITPDAVEQRLSVQQSTERLNTSASSASSASSSDVNDIISSPNAEYASMFVSPEQKSKRKLQLPLINGFAAGGPMEIDSDSEDESVPADSKHSGADEQQEQQQQRIQQQRIGHLQELQRQQIQQIQQIQQQQQQQNSAQFQPEAAKEDVVVGQHKTSLQEHNFHDSLYSDFTDQMAGEEEEEASVTEESETEKEDVGASAGGRLEQSQQEEVNTQQVLSALQLAQQKQQKQQQQQQQEEGEHSESTNFDATQYSDYSEFMEEEEEEEETESVYSESENQPWHEQLKIIHSPPQPQPQPRQPDGSLPLTQSSESTAYTEVTVEDDEEPQQQPQQLLQSQQKQSRTKDDEASQDTQSDAGYGFQLQIKTMQRLQQQQQQQQKQGKKKQRDELSASGHSNTEFSEITMDSKIKRTHVPRVAVNVEDNDNDDDDDNNSADVAYIFQQQAKTKPISLPQHNKAKGLRSTASYSENSYTEVTYQTEEPQQQSQSLLGFSQSQFSQYTEVTVQDDNTYKQQQQQQQQSAPKPQHRRVSQRDYGKRRGSALGDLSASLCSSDFMEITVQSDYNPGNTCTTDSGDGSGMQSSNDDLLAMMASSFSDSYRPEDSAMSIFINMDAPDDISEIDDGGQYNKTFEASMLEVLTDAEDDSVMLPPPTAAAKSMFENLTDDEKSDVDLPPQPQPQPPPRPRPRPRPPLTTMPTTEPITKDATTPNVDDNRWDNSTRSAEFPNDDEEKGEEQDTDISMKMKGITVPEGKIRESSINDAYDAEDPEILYAVLDGISERSLNSPNLFDRFVIKASLDDTKHTSNLTANKEKVSDNATREERDYDEMVESSSHLEEVSSQEPKLSRRGTSETLPISNTDIHYMNKRMNKRRSNADGNTTATNSTGKLGTKEIIDSSQDLLIGSNGLTSQSSVSKSTLENRNVSSNSINEVKSSREATRIRDNEANSHQNRPRSATAETLPTSNTLIDFMNNFCQSREKLSHETTATENDVNIAGSSSHIEEDEEVNSQEIQLHRNSTMPTSNTNALLMSKSTSHISYAASTLAGDSLLVDPNNSRQSFSDASSNTGGFMEDPLLGQSPRKSRTTLSPLSKAKTDNNDNMDVGDVMADSNEELNNIPQHLLTSGESNTEKKNNSVTNKEADIASEDDRRSKHIESMQNSMKSFDLSKSIEITFEASESSESYSIYSAGSKDNQSSKDNRGVVESPSHGQSKGENNDAPEQIKQIQKLENATSTTTDGSMIRKDPPGRRGSNNNDRWPQPTPVARRSPLRLSTGGLQSTLKPPAIFSPTPISSNDKSMNVVDTTTSPANPLMGGGSSSEQNKNDVSNNEKEAASEEAKASNQSESRQNGSSGGRSDKSSKGSDISESVKSGKYDSGSKNSPSNDSSIGNAEIPRNHAASQQAQILASIIPTDESMKKNDRSSNKRQETDRNAFTTVSAPKSTATKPVVEEEFSWRGVKISDFFPNAIPIEDSSNRSIGHHSIGQHTAPGWRNVHSESLSSYSYRPPSKSNATSRTTSKDSGLLRSWSNDDTETAYPNGVKTFGVSSENRNSNNEEEATRSNVEITGTHNGQNDSNPDTKSHGVLRGWSDSFDALSPIPERKKKAGISNYVNVKAPKSSIGDSVSHQQSGLLRDFSETPKHDNLLRDFSDAPRSKSDLLRDFSDAPRKQTELMRNFSEAPRRRTEARREQKEPMRNLSEAPRRQHDPKRDFSEAPRKQNELMRDFSDAPRKQKDVVRDFSDASRRRNESKREFSEAPRKQNELMRDFSDAPTKQSYSDDVPPAKENKNGEKKHKNRWFKKPKRFFFGIK